MVVLVGTISGTSSSVFAQSAPVYADHSNTAEMEIRLQNMEEQVRELTGKVEEKQYEINSLKTKVQNLENKIYNSHSSDDMSPSQPSRARLRNGDMNEDISGLDMPENTAPSKPVLDLAVQDPQGMKTRTVISGNNDATASYEEAYAALKEENFDKAQVGFEKFLAEHGDHILAANAKYWLGETFYVRGDYKQAARTFAEGFQAFPDSAKAPDILFKLGMSLKSMEKTKDACIALAQVSVKFPTGHENIVKLAEEERGRLACE